MLNYVLIVTDLYFQTAVTVKKLTICRCMLYSFTAWKLHLHFTVLPLKEAF